MEIPFFLYSINFNDWHCSERGWASDLSAFSLSHSVRWQHTPTDSRSRLPSRLRVTGVHDWKANAWCPWIQMCSACYQSPPLHLTLAPHSLNSLSRPLSLSSSSPSSNALCEAPGSAGATWSFTSATPRDRRNRIQLNSRCGFTRFHTNPASPPLLPQRSAEQSREKTQPLLHFVDLILT